MPTATVRSIATDALLEIGALAINEAMSAGIGQFMLRRFQQQIDSWQADDLTLSVQQQTPFVLAPNVNTFTIGPGGDLDVQRPVYINGINYVNPGSSPAVEVVMGPMDKDSYRYQTIKGLTSGLPQQYFYQTSLTTAVGDMFIWPTPTQQITLEIYANLGVQVPVSLDTVMMGPPGYVEAFMYQLALRACTPLGRTPPTLLTSMASDAYTRIKMMNAEPEIMGIDQALVPTSGSGYNVLSDTWTASSNG